MSLSSLPPPEFHNVKPREDSAIENKETTWKDVLLNLCDELEPWSKWKIYDTVFAIAIFVLLKRYKLLIPTAKLLQWL